MVQGWLYLNNWSCLVSNANVIEDKRCHFVNRQKIKNCKKWNDPVDGIRDPGSFPNPDPKSGSRIQNFGLTWWNKFFCVGEVPSEVAVFVRTEVRGPLISPLVVAVDSISFPFLSLSQFVFVWLVLISVITQTVLPSSLLLIWYYDRMNAIGINNLSSTNTPLFSHYYNPILSMSIHRFRSWSVPPILITWSLHNSGIISAAFLLCRRINLSPSF